MRHLGMTCGMVFWSWYQSLLFGDVKRDLERLPRHKPPLKVLLGAQVSSALSPLWLTS